MLELYLRFIHFAGLALWLGGLFGMAFLLQAGARHRLAPILADFGATLAIVAGIVNAIQRSLFVQPWLHIKLAVVAVLVVVHVVLRKRMKGDKKGTVLLLPLLILALGILYIAVLKPLHR
jgi:uncharacterized membrane protein